MEHVPPAIGEGPEDSWDVGADRLALGARGAFPAAAFELFPHARVDFPGIDVADSLAGHDRLPLLLATATMGSCLQQPGAHCKRLRTEKPTTSSLTRRARPRRH